MGNNGRITRRQLKGILETQQTPSKSFVAEGDINAIMRRLDMDGDDELSFSDFFSGLLPYFLYGELHAKPKGAIKTKGTSNKENLKSIHVRRAKSQSACRKPN
jgi:hypothetical protein